MREKLAFVAWIIECLNSFGLLLEITLKMMKMNIVWSIDVLYHCQRFVDHHVLLHIIIVFYLTFRLTRFFRAAPNCRLSKATDESYIETMSSVTDNSQVNFNPAWMQSTFAKYRYGREDILALMPQVTTVPEGLRSSRFCVEEGQAPIILSPLTETELRLQQNINSSKALSLLSHQERAGIVGAGSNGNGTSPTSPWQVAGSRNTPKVGSRWSALISGDSPTGGSHYVKAGSQRGGSTAGMSRGGGVAGGMPGRSGIRGKLKTPTAIVAEDPIIQTGPKPEYELWYYLDPNGTEHGPYEAPQMCIWYKSGFFRDDLRCRKKQDHQFTTLGELLQKFGHLEPFQPDLGIRNVENVWKPSPAAEIEQQKLMESQRLIAEERRRLQEREEALRREEEERQERERRVQEMEMDIRRRSEELLRVAQAREEELENKRRLLLERERMQQEELERKRLADQQILEERLQKERLEQERKDREVAQRREEERRREEEKRLQEESRVRREKAEREEAQRKVMMEKERQRVREEQAKLEKARAVQEAQRRREAEEAASRSAATPTHNATKIAPWIANTTNKPAAVQSQCSLLEIQLEQEKVVEKEQRQKLAALEQQKKQNAAKIAGPWAANVSAAASNNSKVWTTPATNGTGAVRVVPSSSAWPAMPTSTPSVKNEVSKNQAKKDPVGAASSEKKEENQFMKWLVKAIQSLNKQVGTSVDAETFSIFIQGIQNPDEVEDYFLSYFGESEDVKEFHHKFLEKRIASRPRKAEKDDLSAAKSAATAAQISTNASSAAAAAATGKNKKKKGKTVDLNALGFMATGDPNRFNAGEIDTAPPMSMKKKR